VTGSLALTATRAGGRTILERVRYDGVSRCSRAFRSGDAALVVLSQLGPGVIRGDAVTTHGRVQAGAHLIVTSQSATRLMGGPRGSGSHATWIVDAGATLELIGEPLVALGGARFAASTTIELAEGARALVSEISAVPPDADVRLRTSIRRSGRELFYDAVDAAAAAPSAVGTFALVGLADTEIAPTLAALDDASDANSEARVGTGALAAGVFARVLAGDPWTVRATLERLREAASSYAFASRNSPAPPTVDDGRKR
jgi:urease accessory protein UreH